MENTKSRFREAVQSKTFLLYIIHLESGVNPVTIKSHRLEAFHIDYNLSVANKRLSKLLKQSEEALCALFPTIDASSPLHSRRAEIIVNMARYRKCLQYLDEFKKETNIQSQIEYGLACWPLIKNVIAGHIDSRLLYDIESKYTKLAHNGRHARVGAGKS